MNQPEKLNLKGKTILIVEDDIVCYQLLREILSDTDAHISHAENTAKAITWLNENPNINLIFMDIQLPDMSGLQASAVIKKRFPHVPIIIQTAFAFESYLKKSKEVGCTDFIEKPLNPSNVLAIVAKYI